MAWELVIAYAGIIMIGGALGCLHGLKHFILTISLLIGIILYVHGIVKIEGNKIIEEYHSMEGE